MNKENLLVLADFLETKVKPENFDMGYYFYKSNFDDEIQPITKKTYSCHTVACALGHGPAAGFKKKRNEPWSSYSERVFGLLAEYDEWMYVFSADWCKVNGTPKGAAKRIRKLVKLGRAPHNWRGKYGV